MNARHKSSTFQNILTYNPTLKTYRRDILFLALFMLYNKKTIHQADIEAKSWQKEFFKYADEIIKYTNSTELSVLAMEFDWTVTEIIQAFDFWEDNSLIAYHDNQILTFTFLGLKRVEFLLSSYYFSKLQEKITLPLKFKHHALQKTKKTNLMKLFEYLMLPSTNYKHVAYAIASFLLLLLIATQTLYNTLKETNVFLTVTQKQFFTLMAVAISATLSFSLSIIFYWIVRIRTRKNYIWNQIDKQIGFEIIILLLCVFNAAASISIILYDLNFNLSSVVGFSKLVLLLGLFFIVMLQVKHINDYNVFQRWFYTYILEAVDSLPQETPLFFLEKMMNSNKSSSSVTTAMNFTALKKFFTEYTKELKNQQRFQIRPFKLNFLLRLNLFQQNNYMIFFFILWFSYISTIGFGAVMAKILIIDLRLPVTLANSKLLVSAVGALMLSSLYLVFYFLFIKPKITDTLTRNRKALPHIFLKNSFHDLLYYKINDELYLTLSRKGLHIVFRFFDLFGISMTATILVYVVLHVFSAVTVFSILSFYFPLVALVFAIPITIIYVQLGILAWISNVEMELEHFDELVTRHLSVEPQAFLQSLFTYYFITPYIAEKKYIKAGFL